jgi:hypothetical protein
MLANLSNCSVLLDEVDPVKVGIIFGSINSHTVRIKCRCTRDSIYNCCISPVILEGFEAL